VPWQEASYLRFVPPLTWQCSPQVQRVLEEVRPGGKMVDLGAGGRQVHPEVVCVDFRVLRGTDLLADVQSLPFADACLDLVIATGLFEHVDDDRRLWSEIARVLRPGGTVHVELPFLQQYHEDPIDYRRLTRAGLERDAERTGFLVRRAGFHIGPTVTMITLLTHYCALWLEGRGVLAKVLSAAVFFACSVAFWPLKFLDRFLAGRPGAHRLAFGVYCTATKV
jgi:SAM-dependent methyltransferase